MNVQRMTRRHDPHWALFALAGALEQKVEAECEAARLRSIVNRVRKINPVMMRNVERSEA